MAESTSSSEAADRSVKMEVEFPSLKLLKRIAQTPMGHEGRIDEALEELLRSKLYILVPPGKKISVRQIDQKS